MKLKTVAVIGASGMLGSMVLDVLSQDEDLKLISTVRTKKLAELERSKFKNVDWRLLDVEKDNTAELRSAIHGASYIVNAIGVIKPYIHDDNPVETERAIKVNSLFPYKLAQLAVANRAQILQITTDCVYSGSRGSYVETDRHDALDVYGKSKSLGEALLPNVHNLRCSIIGPENKGYLSLLEWFLHLPRNAHIEGYINHRWNGITTLHFARICLGIIQKNVKLPPLQHIVPKDVVTKAELLRLFASEYNRGDIVITPTNAKIAIDRTLATKNESLNRELWRAAGYEEPPSISQMIAELARYSFRR